MLKTIIGKLEIKNIITWMSMWLNWSVVLINVTLQFLDTYRGQWGDENVKERERLQKQWGDEKVKDGRKVGEV